MNNINENEIKANGSETKGKALKVIKKALLYSLSAIGIALLLVVAYKVLEFLFVGLVLLLAYAGPRRWWW